MRQDLVRQLSANLRLGLSGEDLSRLTKAPTADTQAYQLYLQGRHHLNQRNLGQSIDYFQQAIRRDPRFALAYAGLADSYSLRGWYDVEATKDAYQKAREAATKAIALDQDLAEAYASLAMIHSDHDWNWPEAETNYRRAIRLNPSYPTVHEWYGLYLIGAGRSQEGLQEVQRAEKLDPLSPIISTALAEAFYLSRDYDQSLAQYRKALGIDPSFLPAKRGLAFVLAEKGMCEEALQTVNDAIGTSPEDPRTLAAQGYTLARCGRKSEAEKVVRQLEGLRPVPGYYGLAVVSAALGQRDAALGWLDKAYQERSGPLVYLQVRPVFDSLRDDPRFQELAARLKLPGPAQRPVIR